jgi:hypothetical protein
MEWEMMPGPQTWEALEAHLQKNLVGLQREIELAVEAETVVLTNAVATAMAVEFSPHSRTGGTIRGMRTMVSGTMGLITMAGGAPYIEWGTKAHGPAGRKVMKFVSGGQTFFRSWVRGVQRDPFVERALDRVGFVHSYTHVTERIFDAYTHGLERFMKR